MTRARNSANLASHGNLFVDITNDRTGIGSVVPDQNLHVAGTAGFHDDVTFTGDLYNTTWDRSANSLKFSDSAKALFGTDSDLTIRHTGSTGYLENATGFLFIHGNDIALRSQAQENYIVCDANAEVEIYYDGSKKLETTAYGINVTGTTDTDGLVVSGVATVTTMNVTGVLTYDDVTSVDSVGIVTARDHINIVTDNKKLQIGASQDLALYHDGTNSRIHNTNTGSLIIRNEVQDADVFIQGNDGGSNVNLLAFDTSETGMATLHGELNMRGTHRIKFNYNTGNGGFNSFIGHQFTSNSFNFVINNQQNNIFIENDNVVFRGKSGQGDDTLAQFTKSGAVTLYYSGSFKLQTTSFGVNVTGTTDTDGLVVSGISTFSGGDINIGSAVNTPRNIIFSADRGANAELGNIIAKNTGGNAASISFSSGPDGTNKDDGQIVFKTSPHSGQQLFERFRITEGGNLISGITTPNTTVLGSRGPRIQLESTTVDASSIFLNRDGNDGGGPYLFLGHGRGGNGLIQDGDNLGNLMFMGGTGSNFRGAANVSCIVDIPSGGAASSTSMPGALVLSTSNHNQNSPVEAMRIRPDGRIVMGGSTAVSFAPHANADDLVVGATSAANRGITILGGNNNRASIYFGDTDDNDVGQIDYNHNNNAMAFNTNGNERLRITSGGSVGINQTAPEAQLHVENNNAHSSTYYLNTDAAILVDNKNNSGKAVIKLEHDAALVYGSGSSSFIIADRENERLRIDASGNVMIGRTSASKKFSVREGSTSSGVYYVQQIAGSNHLANYAVGIAFDPEGYAARTKMALVAEGIGQGYSRGKFHFLLDAANDSGEATLSESRMTITDAGNVGINHNSPNTQLVVRAPGGSGHASAQVHSGDGNTIINMQTVQGTEGRFGMNTNHPLCFYTNGLQHLKMTTTGALQQTASSGVSYFKGSSEYVFGSDSSSPPSGGPEGKFQIHDHKTRVTLSLNAYMNNAGAPILQFLSSRSGTKGTLGTKAAINDYHGDLRFMGDNGTNNNSLVQSAQILVRQKSTISDGDTVCAGEISFYTGSDSGGSILERLRIDAGGRLTLENSEGIKLSPKNSSLYALDGTLSYYATNNGVYLNGAGANGWLRLQASGVANDRTSINLIGQSAGGGDSIRFKTNSTERLRIKNDGLISIANPSGSGTGALTIFPNSITGNGRLDVYGGGDENNQSASRNEVMRIGRGDILDSYYHSIWSATGSGGSNSHFLKFYVSNGNAGATNQVEALSMNGVGQVSMPSQPSFLAEHTHASGNHKQKGELINQFIRNFQHVRHNTGNCYNNSTGKFTAPSDGIYLFHIDFTMDGGDGNDDSAGCYFRVENNSANYNRTHSSNRDFHSVDPRLHSTSTGYEVNASFQTIEKLAAGATVGWYFTDWDYTGTRITTCFFSGYKVG